jgi:hypothetical protein
MLGPFQDIFAREVPVAPTEVSDLVQALEIPTSTFFISKRELPDIDVFSTGLNPSQKLAMITWSVLAEVAQDLGKRRIWHRNLK